MSTSKPICVVLGSKSAAFRACRRWRLRANRAIVRDPERLRRLGERHGPRLHVAIVSGYPLLVDGNWDQWDVALNYALACGAHLHDATEPRPPRPWDRLPSTEYVETVRRAREWCAERGELVPAHVTHDGNAPHAYTQDPRSPWPLGWPAWDRPEPLDILAVMA